MIVRLILISKCRSVHLNILYLLFRIFAPVCNICNTSITPVEGTDETVRVVAMEKDFHVDCYVCEVSIEYLLPKYLFIFFYCPSFVKRDRKVEIYLPANQIMEILDFDQF